MGTTQECYFYFEQILEATPHKKAAVWPLTSSLKNHSIKTNKTWDTAREARTNLLVVFFYGPLHRTCQCWLTSKNLFTSNLCRHRT